MAIFEPQTLMYFYHKGFSNVDAIGGYVTKWPDRLVMGSRWDPRDGEKGKALLEEQVKKFRIRPFQMRNVKLYTAEWKEENGGESRGCGVRSQPAAVLRRDDGQPPVLARPGPDLVQRGLRALASEVDHPGLLELRNAGGLEEGVRGRPHDGD